MGFVLTAVAIQSIGTCLVAFFLWQLGRAIQVRFLTSWALAAVTLAVALGFLYVTFQVDPRSWVGRASFGVYAVGGYVTAFLFWSGLREYTHDRPFALSDAWRIAPFGLFGLVAPWALGTSHAVQPFHFLLLGMLFLAALPATRFARPAAASVGMPIVRVGLVALSCLMFVQAYLLSGSNASIESEFTFVWLSVLFDALVELLIVFGTVILACERVRDQLQANNVELAAAKLELEKVARTDGLTGLLNRRAFEEWQGAHASNAQYVGCLAVVDLNDLKRLNDTHLHAAGDAALRLVARALVAKFRVTDPIFRIGGDEFVIVMPGGSEAELRNRLAAIDGGLANQRLPGVTGTHTLVVAWGTATFANGDALTAAYQRADQEMYAQKAARKAGWSSP
jgi:diguanylate cyclase (GGDEF)-like protein